MWFVDSSYTLLVAIMFSVVECIYDQSVNQISMAGFWLISSQVRDELLAMRKGDTIDNHFVMACFLVQEGADVNIRNRAAHTPIQLCSSEMSTLMINFVNKSR